MDEGRKKSTVLFLILGVFLVGGILFAFLILPSMNKTFGSSNVKLSFPLDKIDLRVLDGGMELFCKDESKYMGLECRVGSRASVVRDGVVKEVDGNRVIIDVGESMEVEYVNLSRLSVSVGDYVLEGDTVGFVDGSVLLFGVRDSKERVYLCPYTYFDDEGISIVNRELDRVEYFDSICLCKTLEY